MEPLAYICKNRIQFRFYFKNHFLMRIIDNPYHYGYSIWIDGDSDDWTYNTLGHPNFTHFKESLCGELHTDGENPYDSYLKNKHSIISHNEGNWYAWVPPIYIRPFTLLSDICHYNIHNKKLNKFINHIQRSFDL